MLKWGLILVCRQPKQTSLPEADHALVSEGESEEDSMSDGSLFKGRVKVAPLGTGRGGSRSRRTARDSGKERPHLDNGFLPQKYEQPAKGAQSDDVKITKGLEVKGQGKRSADSLRNAVANADTSDAEKKHVRKRVRPENPASPDSIMTSKSTSGAAGQKMSPTTSPANRKAPRPERLATLDSHKASEAAVKTSGSGAAKRGPRNRPPKGFLSQTMARTKEIESEQKEGTNATNTMRDIEPDKKPREGRAGKNARGAVALGVAQDKDRPGRKAAGEQKKQSHITAQKEAAAQNAGRIQLDLAQKLGPEAQRSDPVKGCGIMAHRPDDDTSSSGVQVPVEDEAHAIELTSPMRGGGRKGLNRRSPKETVEYAEVGR